MATSSDTTGIDPRGPRFGAGITAVLLLITIGLGLARPDASGSIAERVTEPAFVLLTILTAIFAWGAFAGIRKHPYGLLFAALIKPRLQPPSFREPPEPPHFCSAHRIPGEQCRRRPSPCRCSLWAGRSSGGSLHCGLPQLRVWIVPRLRALRPVGSGSAYQAKKTSPCESPGRVSRKVRERGSIRT